MSFKRYLIHQLNHSSSIHNPTKYLYTALQKRNINGPPTPPLLQQLQHETHPKQDTHILIKTPTFSDDDTQLFTRTLITPKPFNRYHHLWLHKTLTNEKRIKNLPIPTPNYKILPIITCIIQHINSNGPSTLETLWKGLRPLGVVRSKRRLKKTIKKYMEKYPDTLPFVNIHKHNMESESKNENESHSESDSNSDSDMESGTESDSEFKIDSDFSESDSGITTAWDTDGLQVSIYDIRPEKKEKIIKKYDKKWTEIENNISCGKIQLYHENTNLWWYSIHEHNKPVAKGPILWDELIQRAKTDKKTKGKLNKNKITNQTPVFNFAYMDYWKVLSDVMKQV
eukprot:228392_1